MPSGAKKRKAAKKRKGTQPSNNPNPSLASTQGGSDVKHQDDRQSDVGEASSTASQDHPSHHDLLTEGEEEKVESSENASDLPRVEGVKIEGDDDKHDVVIEGNAVPVEREFKIEDELGEKFEHDETERKSYDGGSSGSSSSSSSSSSDDESHGVESSHHAVVDAAAPVSVQVDHSLHEENIEALPTTTIGEASEAVVDSVPPVVSDKVSLLSEGVEVDTSSPAKSSVAPSVFKENGGGSETFKDEAPQPEESTIPSVEYVVATSNQKACAAEETDERLSLSYNAPIATHDNGADPAKDSGVTEPLLVPPPRPAQTTSWKGCCGLFELFTGSDR